MKRFSIVSQVVFFVLTVLAVAALYWYCEVVHLPKGWIVLVSSIALAEILIRRFGYWRTGVEAGLWVAGLCGFIFSLPSSGKPEAILVFVAAFAIVAARLRHPVAGVAAIVLTLVYLDAKDLEPYALLAGLAASVIASFFARRLFFALTAIVAPVAGYVIHKDFAVLIFATALIDLAIGIRIRERAPLIAGALCAAIGFYEIRNLFPLVTEAKLILGGVALLATSTALMRLLRDRKTGIVVTPTKPHELQDAVQIGAMLRMATPDAGPAEPRPVGGGGEFGGAGASGQY